MLKKNTLLRSCLYITMAAVVTLSITAGTFAKYTTEKTVSDSARVAKFDVSLGSDSSTIDIFKTAYGTSGTEEIKAANGTDKVVAPGASGDFSIDVVNNGEVAVAVSTTATGTGLDKVPLIFKFGENYYSDYFEAGAINAKVGAADVASITIAGNVQAMFTAAFTGSETIAANAGNGGKLTKEMSWFWPAESYKTTETNVAGGDSRDTTLGEAGTQECTIEVTMTATQVLPPTA